jgi:mRNA interferase RelE/StbE
MMYTVKINKRVTKFVKKQDMKTKQRLQNAILEILENPYEASNIEMLSGYENIFRKRVGDVRIIYQVVDKVAYIYVLDAGNRGDVYKRW